MFVLLTSTANIPPGPADIYLLILRSLMLAVCKISLFCTMSLVQPLHLFSILSLVPLRFVLRWGWEWKTNNGAVEMYEQLLKIRSVILICSFHLLGLLTRWLYSKRIIHAGISISTIGCIFMTNNPLSIQIVWDWIHISYCAAAHVVLWQWLSCSNSFPNMPGTDGGNIS